MTILLLGVGLAMVGCLIYSGMPWVRHALMTGVVAIGISGFIRPEYSDIPLGVLIVVAVMAIGVGVRHLYFRPDVIAHFTTNQKEAERDCLKTPANAGDSLPPKGR